MSVGSSSFEFKTRLWASAGCAALAAALFALSACGVLSSPERDETPSALMLRAQAAYDSGSYSEAVTLLEKAVDLDPANEEARVRLAFSYNGSLGITPLNMIKNLTSSSTSTSGNSDITKLTNGSGLPKARTDKIKENKSSLTNVAALRQLFPEFTTFQKAFLSLCPLFSSQTLTTLKQKVPTAEVLLEVSKCNSGVPTSNANVSIAALSLAIEQFSSLYKSILDTDGDGRIDVEKDAADASASLNNLTDINSLNQATRKLTLVASTLKGEVFKLSMAQFSIISAVIVGSSLPSSVKDPLQKAVSGIEDMVQKIDGYLDAGKATASSNSVGGQSAQQAAQKANTQADSLLATKTTKEKQDTCNQLYCFRTAYGLPTEASDMPSQCTGISYLTTCTQ